MALPISDKPKGSFCFKYYFVNTSLLLNKMKIRFSHLHCALDARISFPLFVTHPGLWREPGNYQRISLWNSLCSLLNPSLSQYFLQLNSEIKKTKYLGNVSKNVHVLRRKTIDLLIACSQGFLLGKNKQYAHSFEVLQEDLGKCFESSWHRTEHLTPLLMLRAEWANLAFQELIIPLNWILIVSKWNKECFGLCDIK